MPPLSFMAKLSALMIVKNEAHLIERGLETLSAFVDFYTIIDTGSTDDTVKIILSWLKKNYHRGVVAKSDWKDFATNRTEVIRLAEARSDCNYGMAFDADDLLLLDRDPKEIKRSLSRDIYNLKLFNHGSDEYYTRSMICKLNGKFFYRSVLHEHLTCKDFDFSAPVLEGVSVCSIREGARNLNPNKYLDDVRVLLGAIKEKIDPDLEDRYQYYLAQSYYDAKHYTAALRAFARRVDMGGWHEEVYVSLLRMAWILSSGDLGNGRDSSQVIINLLNKAITLCPYRAEAYFSLARHYRKNNMFRDAVEVCRKGLESSSLSNEMYVQRWLYNYGLKDELFVNLCAAENFEDAELIITEISCCPNIRDKDVERIKNNLQAIKSRHEGVKCIIE